MRQTGGIILTVAPGNSTPGYRPKAGERVHESRARIRKASIGNGGGLSLTTPYLPYSSLLLL